MCRADVEPQAQDAVAHPLGDIPRSLADQAKVDVARVLIGPVDSGSPDEREITA
jgi:hypothetical protein